MSDGRVYVKRYPKGQSLFIGDDWHAWCRHCCQVVSKFDWDEAGALACLAHHVKRSHPAVTIQESSTSEKGTDMSSPIHSTTNEAGRFYTHPSTGEKFWSVTTISKALAKPFLIPWAAKVVAEGAIEEWDHLCTLKPAERIQRMKGAHARITNRAGARGSQVHAIIEDWLREGQPQKYDIRSVPKCSDLEKWNNAGEKPITVGELQSYFDGFRSWCEHYSPKFLHSETTVWNRSEKYAGTLDLIAMLFDKCTILDAKSGSGVYPEVGLQLAPYARAEFFVNERGEEQSLPAVEAAYALHVQPKHCVLYPVNISDEVYRSFLYIREAFRFQEVISKNILGPEIKAELPQKEA